MTAAAAASGLGVALVPRLLIEAELARGELVQAHPLALAGDRSYFLVWPASSEARSPALEAFAQWLERTAR